MKRSLIVFVAIISSVPLMGFFFWWSGLIFTCTGSMPTGFYRIVPTKHIEVGDVVSFCLPKEVAKEGIIRHYINEGRCENGSQALLKEVIATPGDQVRLTDDAIFVKGVGEIDFPLHYEAPIHIVDSNHLLVHRFTRSRTYLSKGYWMYGVGSPKYSWDSRYYGEIPAKNIKHKLVPFLLF